MAAIGDTFAASTFYRDHWTDGKPQHRRGRRHASSARMPPFAGRLTLLGGDALQ
jgi:hypothetical protein